MTFTHSNKPAGDVLVQSQFTPHCNDKALYRQRPALYHIGTHTQRSYHNTGLSYNMQISCFRLAKNVNSCDLQKLLKDDIVQICRVKVFLSKM